MSFTGGEGVPGRGKSTDKASAEVGKQEVRSQFDSGLGYGVQMAEAGAARAPWGLLGVGGGGRRVRGRFLIEDLLWFSLCVEYFISIYNHMRHMA